MTFAKRLASTINATSVLKGILSLLNKQQFLNDGFFKHVADSPDWLVEQSRA